VKNQNSQEAVLGVSMDDMHTNINGRMSRMSNSKPVCEESIERFRPLLQSLVCRGLITSF